MDLYRNWRPGKDQAHLVFVGRLVGFVALALAVITAKPLLGDFDQAFQYIQEFTGFFTPGICAIFLLGMFWKRMTTNGAYVAAIGSAMLSLAMKLYMPEIAFMDRVGLVFVCCVLAAGVVSLLHKNNLDKERVVDLSKAEFASRLSYDVAAAGTVLILIAFYVTWW